MLEETTRGWIAGILDFQGHIVRKDTAARKTQTLALYVQCRESAIIRRLCDLTGNGIETIRTHPLKAEWTRRGCAEHCPQAHVHHLAAEPMPDMAKWCVSGCALAVVLWNVHDLLVTDKEPWGWAMGRTLGLVCFTGQGSGAVNAAIRRLDGLGWEIPQVLQDGKAEASNAG
jgi:hypothetical protein